MFRRLLVITALWIALFSLFASGMAVAQENGDASAGEGEATAEPLRYGDAELIEALRTYDLLDEWLAASPVSAQAALLQVRSSSYQTRRQQFLNSLEAWAKRTEQVRGDVARLDAAQADTDQIRSAVIGVRDALVLDDRLASNSKTLVAIEDSLTQLEAVTLTEHEPGHAEDSLTLAEVQLTPLRALAQTELQALNGITPAISNSGVGAFTGFDDLRIGLNAVDELIKRGRHAVRPARQESERLVASALRQIPELHAARMLGSTDVDGLSVVTVDAYIRAAERSSCSVDWALLAGIGKIESNHGRIGGASVARTGKVSTNILGPLLDGGQTEREQAEAEQVDEDQRAVVVEAVRAAQRAVREAFAKWRLYRYVFGQQLGMSAAELADAAGDTGNGFAVIVDSDGGRLDGNDRWDRAIGPMQFLPETWSKWATDGNRDGVADPHNLYDATASASRFLCDLSASRGSSPSTFVLGYNGSTSYVRSVLRSAESLRARALPTG